MYWGWLEGEKKNSEDDTILLKNLGIKILKQGKIGTIIRYEVKMSNEAENKLDEYWGKFIWGLKYKRNK